jgi:hypothetical protein
VIEPPKPVAEAVLADVPALSTAESATPSPPILAVAPQPAVVRARTVTLARSILFFTLYISVAVARSLTAMARALLVSMRARLVTEWARASARAVI